MTPRGLHDLERRAWLRTFEHGLWDIGIGLLLLSFAAAILTELYWITPLWVPVVVPSIQGFGRHLVDPRIGRATFGKRRRHTKTRIQVLLAGLSILGLAMFLLTAWAGRSFAPACAPARRQHAGCLLRRRQPDCYDWRPPFQAALPPSALRLPQRRRRFLQPPFAPPAAAARVPQPFPAAP